MACEKVFKYHSLNSLYSEATFPGDPYRSNSLVKIRNAHFFCFHQIKRDFPHKWPQVVDQISIHLDTGVDNWLGALTCLYQLVKCYEYKKKEERSPLNDAMNLLLPMIYKIFIATVPGKDTKYKVNPYLCFIGQKYIKFWLCFFCKKDIKRSF